MRARGGDLMPETIPPVGLLIVRSDPGNPGVRAVDFDRQKRGINSEAVTKSVPSHAVGERYEVFICFNRHNPIL